MTISKEERAELRDLIHEVSKGDPNFPRWDYDGSNPFEHPEVLEHSPVGGGQHIGNLPSKWHTRLACAAVNASPKILAALDAADERIAGLEAENRRALGLVDNGLAHVADWQSLLYRADERASADANAHTEEVAELKSRIAGLEAEVAECHTDLNERSVAAVEAGMDRLIASEIGKLETQVASLKARIAALEAAAQWRPIEEAPKDGKDWFIVARAGTQLRGPAYWCDGRWCQGVHEEPLHFTPTHFCELPDAPALPEGGA